MFPGYFRDVPGMVENLLERFSTELAGGDGTRNAANNAADNFR